MTLNQKGKFATVILASAGDVMYNKSLKLKNLENPDLKKSWKLPCGIKKTYEQLCRLIFQKQFYSETYGK